MKILCVLVRALVPLWRNHDDVGSHWQGFVVHSQCKLKVVVEGRRDYLGTTCVLIVVHQHEREGRGMEPLAARIRLFDVN